MVVRIPEPEQGPDGPVYEGRLLDRPGDEVVDQGVRFDLGTLLNRRTILSAGLFGLGAVALTACTAQASGPSGTGGPAD